MLLIESDAGVGQVQEFPAVVQVHTVLLAVDPALMS
jgi:hypothetical protein